MVLSWNSKKVFSSEDKNKISILDGAQQSTCERIPFKDTDYFLVLLLSHIGLIQPRKI